MLQAAESHTASITKGESHTASITKGACCSASLRAPATANQPHPYDNTLRRIHWLRGTVTTHEANRCGQAIHIINARGS